LRADNVELDRFEKRVNLRKFDKFVTDVQVHADEIHGNTTTA